MNRLTELFSRKNNRILSVYFTAGYPELNDTQRLLTLLQDNGADIIEIGFPFSDPIADGTVIQNSSHAAIVNGMSLNLLFAQLAEMRKTINIPIILMGYLNPIMQMGFENFCKDCQKVGVDGFILPDMPVEVYKNEYEAITLKYGLSNIMLVTPETSDERIRHIDNLSSGFVYLVSAASTTGARDSFDDEQKAYFKRVAAMKLKNPLMIGFGISNKSTLESAFEHASGAIIGSAFIKSLTAGKLEESVKNFFAKLKE